MDAGHSDVPAHSHSQADEGAPKDNTGEQQDCSQCCIKVAEIHRLLEENRKLKEELSRKSLDENFMKDDSMVKYYTGLPSFALLMGVLTQILPSLPKSTTGRKLSHFQMLLLTLMRMRLNLPLDHLAHLFDISRQHTSTVFCDNINVLYAHLSPLVHWPERHCMQDSMPHQFVEMFDNRVRVIIDCFELFIERAQNLRAKAQTYSNYKGRQYSTRNHLFYFQRGGGGGGGGGSDKQIAEESGFLQKLSPGDMVLADRGFDIKESVAFMGTTLKTPAFTKGRSQLDSKDVEETRKIAHVRIHVERVIGLMRSKYNILNDTIRLNMVLPCEGEGMTLLDKIVVVSCALTIMSPSIVVKPSF
ncbi:uncharacterized protein LOC117250756 [Epinephelus lanceolatus]